MSDFSSPTGIAWNAGGKSGLAKYGADDDQMLVVFYNKAVENPAKSVAAGRRICENIIYIMIQQPGEHLNKVDRPANDADKVRFRGHWNKFLNNRQQIPEGTPIDLLFPNNPAFAENLRAYGVYTIEQCASLSANAIDNIGRGGTECVNKAKLYLENSNKGVNFHILVKKIDEYESKFKAQEHQISVLKAQLDNVLMKQNNPNAASLSPTFIPGYDAQAERLNANHPTKEVVEKAKAKKPKKEEIDAIPFEPIYKGELPDDPLKGV